MARLLVYSALIGPAVLLAGCQSLSPSASPSSLEALESPVASPVNPIGRIERSLVFYPSPASEGDWRAGGQEFEDAWFEAADGTRLHGWYADQPEPRAVILFCHGNAGNVALWSDVLRELREIGAAALLFDYRGYGRSEGTPSEAGLSSDARAARRWLAARAGVKEQDIVLMGRSIGAAVAVDLAAADGARGLVLESTFTSLPAVARLVMPWLPVRSFMRMKFDSLAKIGNYHGPLLQSHGTADRLVPYSMAQELFAAANEPKEFVPILGADHNDPQNDEYYAALGRFLDRT